MRQRIIDNLPREAGDFAALPEVRHERFLVYVMGPYRTFDVAALLPEGTDAHSENLSSFATWEASAGEYSEDEVLTLLEATRDCLREREFNAFLAIDVGIPLEEMDAATQSIEFAREQRRRLRRLTSGRQSRGRYRNREHSRRHVGHRRNDGTGC